MVQENLTGAAGHAGARGVTPAEADGAGAGAGPCELTPVDDSRPHPPSAAAPKAAAQPRETTFIAERSVTAAQHTDRGAGSGAATAVLARGGRPPWNPPMA